MLKKLSFALLAGAFLAPAFAEAKTPITLWHAYRGKEKGALEQVAAAFNKSNANIEVTLLSIPYDAFPDKVTASVPRGKGPDLFIFAQDRLGDWAVSKVIEPIDFWMDDALRDAFLPPTLEALTYDDQVYGLPIAYKTVALFYNKKLIKTPPATTDELIKMAAAQTNPKAGKYGLVYENASFYYQGPWYQGFGAKVFDKSGKPTLDSKAAIDSMAFAQKLAHSAGIMPEDVASTLVTTLFNQGKAAFVINGPWFMGELEPSVDFGVAVLPTINEVNQPARPFLSSEGLMMSAKAADKKAAFEVMKYFTSVESGTIMATVGRQTAANKAVYANPKVASDPILSVFQKQLAVSIPMPNSPAMRMVWSPATTAMNKVINGKKSPEESMKKAQAEVEELLKGARR